MFGIIHLLHVLDLAWLIDLVRYIELLDLIAINLIRWVMNYTYALTVTNCHFNKQCTTLYFWWYIYTDDNIRIIIVKMFAYYWIVLWRTT